jgi:hypothetical protein
MVKVQPWQERRREYLEAKREARGNVIEMPSALGMPPPVPKSVPIKDPEDDPSAA